MMRALLDDKASSRSWDRLPRLEFHTRGGQRAAVNDNADFDWETNERVVEDADAVFWRLLMHRTGMFSILSADARRRWDEQTTRPRRHWSEGDAPVLPPLTRENVLATFGELFERREELRVEGVVSVFKSLSWDYKTNRPRKFGRRLILRGCCGDSTYSHNTADQLDDLLRVLYRHDDLPEPDHRMAMHNELRRAWDEGRDAATPYFTVRLHKNGNGHVTFTRHDAVESLNRIVAGAFPDCLPAET